jgi:long-chain acyl-CoA synthetase
VAEPISASSIPGLLRERVRATPDHEALRHRTDDGWRSLTWSQVEEQVRDLALGLAELGVGDEARVAILSGTRVEWIIADLAVLAAGGATTTVYPSNTADESAHILADSGSVVVIAENEAQVDKLRSVRDQIPAVRHVVVIDGEAGGDDWVMTLDEVRARGRERDPAEFERTVDSITPDRLATLIYTSGTTGRPKGVELTHANWLYTARAVIELDVLGPDDLHFLWLPMSHAFGKMLEVVMIGAGVPTAVDGAVGHITGNLRELQPTIVAAAPRIFEKIYNSVQVAMREEGGLKLALFRGARKVAGANIPRWTVLPAIADRLVFARLRERFGGRVRYFVSGSAPLASQIGEFFSDAGMPVLEGYGLTESSAASFIVRPDDPRPGTVGPPLPGTEVRIAADGEVLIRGDGVMRGYHRLPEETAATLVDGWLHTGDIGELDDAGRLRITDRKKELIKTSGGKYVAPAHVEGRIKASSPYISNVLVHGDRRNFCVALVTLDADTASRWAPDDPGLRAEIGKAIDRVNAGLARHETVKNFAILAEDFSTDRGELTPSGKVRRREVEKHYQDLLDGFYTGTIERG